MSREDRAVVCEGDDLMCKLALSLKDAKIERLEGVAAGLRAELDAVTDTLRTFIESVERDLHEPDKLLCHVASARRRLVDAQAASGGAER